MPRYVSDCGLAPMMASADADSPERAVPRAEGTSRYTRFVAVGE